MPTLGIAASAASDSSSQAQGVFASAFKDSRVLETAQDVAWAQPSMAATTSWDQEINPH